MVQFKVKEIISFKTSDDKIFENLQEAEKHQASLDIIKWADRNGLNSSYPWDSDGIAMVILEYAKELRDLLNDYVGNSDE